LDIHLPDNQRSALLRVGTAKIGKKAKPAVESGHNILGLVNRVKMVGVRGKDIFPKTRSSISPPCQWL